MKSYKTIIMLFLSALLLGACSGDNDKESKPGKIDTMTKEIGQEAVRTIKVGDDVPPDRFVLAMIGYGYKRVAKSPSVFATMCGN